MKSVALDWSTMGPGIDVSELQTLLPGLEFFDHSKPDQVVSRIASAEIVLLNKVRLDATLIRGAPNLKFIGIMATGTDNIDLDTARQRSIGVANIRDYCTRSVAEHVIGCLLSLAHSLPAYDRTVRRGEWQEAENFCLLNHPIESLSAMTLGIVGYGNLGRGVAELAKAIGMEVIVTARRGVDRAPAGRVTFDELLTQSDAISLHCPLTDDTHHLFSTRQFDAMKPTAFLINTARGALIDSGALVDALQTGKIAAAAIDVLPNEPPVDGDPLLDYAGDELLVTPHIAWATRQARQAAVDELVANVRSYLAGGDRNRVA